MKTNVRDPKILKSVVKKKPLNVANAPPITPPDKSPYRGDAEPKAYSTTSRAPARRYGATSQRDSGHNNKARTTAQAPHSQSYDACVALVGKPVKIKLRGTTKATAYPKLLVVHTYQLVAQTTDGNDRIINKHAIDYIEPIKDGVINE